MEKYVRKKWQLFIERQAIVLLFERFWFKLGSTTDHPRPTISAIRTWKISEMKIVPFLFLESKKRKAF